MTSLTSLYVVVICCCYMLLLYVVVICCCYMLLLYVVVICCCYMLLLYVVVTCCCYMFLLTLNRFHTLLFSLLLIFIMRTKWSLGLRDWNGTRTHNDLVRKRTLNHLAKLAKWLSCVVSTYLYGAFLIMSRTCFRVNPHSIPVGTQYCGDIGFLLDLHCDVDRLRFEIEVILLYDIFFQHHNVVTIT